MQQVGYLVITFIILFFIIIQALIPEHLSKLGDTKHDCVSDAESRLACGFPIKLKVATLYDLELIPGISDLLAKRILTKRNDIINKARNYKISDKHKAFELVHGIGVTKAKKLALDLTPD